jgi:hypothetical protein
MAIQDSASSCYVLVFRFLSIVSSFEKFVKHDITHAVHISVCFSSSTYVSHHKNVSVLYTQGFWNGELGSDVLKFPTLRTPQVRCDIAAIKTSNNIYMNGSHWQVLHIRTQAIPISLVFTA